MALTSLFPVCPMISEVQPTSPLSSILCHSLTILRLLCYGVCSTGCKIGTCGGSTALEATDMSGGGTCVVNWSGGPEHGAEVGRSAARRGLRSRTRWGG